MAIVSSTGAGKGDAQRPVNPIKWDNGWLRAFGVCTKHYCPKSWACHRFCVRGKIKTLDVSRAYVPVSDVNSCKWYVPATCELCGGKGWNKDWNRTQRKFIKTLCLVCKGKGKLVYDDFNKEKKDEANKG